MSTTVTPPGHTSPARGRPRRPGGRLARGHSTSSRPRALIADPPPRIQTLRGDVSGALLAMTIIPQPWYEN
jgi:hypothetical protein